MSKLPLPCLNTQATFVSKFYRQKSHSVHHRFLSVNDVAFELSWSLCRSALSCTKLFPFVVSVANTTVFLCGIK